MNPIQLSGKNFVELLPHFCQLEYFFRHIEPQQRPFKATDNYPGPPNVGGKMMGSVRCPSYSRAVRGLHNADRSPPPDYKSNRNGKSNEIIETIDETKALSASTI